jgi:6-pyruvoyltetrahydropterin/6-carboxytetrahydropterin synthase
MSLSVKRVFRFEASHHLPNHLGKCKNVHGHSYKLEVEVEESGLVLNKPTEQKGMIVDFSLLSELVKQVIIDKVDHQDLNNLFENPTAEEMVRVFMTRLGPGIHEMNLCLKSLTLWETENCCAIWRIR